MKLPDLLRNKVLIISIGLVFVIAVVIYLSSNREQTRITVTLPTGEVVQAVRAKRMDPEKRQKLLYVTITGKVDLVSVNPSNSESTTRVVLISNQGELVLLINPEMVNSLRFGGYINKIVTLKGYWYGKLPFRGRMYRSMWVENIITQKNKI